MTYSKLQVVSLEGRFDGTLKLTNSTAVHADALVTVHVYNEDQDVGELSGNISLKPHSIGRVDLESFDHFRDFTDTTVELLPLRAAVH